MESRKVKAVRSWFSFIAVMLLGAVLLAGCAGGGNPPAKTPTPAGVTASTGDGQVTIAWATVPDATSYNIYLSTTSGVTPANGTKITSAANPYTLTGLTNGTTYYFVVTAVNFHGVTGTGESAASLQASCTPEPVPTEVTATTGDGQATIVWTPATGATSYNLYWSTSAGVTPASGAKITGATSPYIKTGLTNGTPYYFVVTAVTGTGESAVSSQASCTPGRPVPTGVTANPGIGQATIAWTPVTGATSYNIYWSATAGMTANVTQITGATNPYTLTGLTNGTPYYFAVTAVNGNGESAFSSLVSATPTTTPPPAAPTGVTVTPGDGQVTIMWPLVELADSYNIYWSTTSGVTPANGSIKITSPTNPYILTGLTNSTTYYFVVTAVNSNGESTASSQVSCTPQQPVPTGVTATPGSGQVTIEWTPVSGALSYNIYYRNFAGEVTPSNGLIIRNATSPYTLTGLTNGTTYYFAVSDIIGTRESKLSAQVSATPQ